MSAVNKMNRQQLIEENERLRALAEEAEALKKAQAAQPIVTDDGKILRPALSPEEQQAEDERVAQEFEAMLGDDNKPDPEPANNQAPALIRPSLETDERDTGLHGKIASFGGNGENEQLIQPAKDVDIDVAAHQSWQDNVNFMKQKVRIHILQSQRREDDPIFSICVNGGKPWTFERNKEYTVPRFVVEGLLRAKPVNYGNEEYVRPDGVQDVRYPISQGVRYPFSIVEDPYPKWREWMRYTMAQPN